MGVPIGDADGEYIILLLCPECEEKFESDETMMNVCPDCGAPTNDVQDGYATDPELSWRDQ